MFSTKIRVPEYSDDLPDLVRLVLDAEVSNIPSAELIFEDHEGGCFQLGGLVFSVKHSNIRELIGDVILVNRERGSAERIIRFQSNHNTLLITERCDQVCVMCSQPPKDYELDLFEVYERAVVNAAFGATIGVSGGEPLLYKERLFQLFEACLAQRPDLSFHVLTNAQHLTSEDHKLWNAFPADRIRFAVPLYSSNSTVHDGIVGKDGAFDLAIQGIGVLLSGGFEVEIRTVIMKQNARQLIDLARMISWQMPDINHWAIMQLEYIGFAKKNWEDIFFDHSLEVGGLVEAVGSAQQHGVPCVLYNMPLCTLPDNLRLLAPKTISDWKQKFFEMCDGCSAKSLCSGFFAWQPFEKSFRLMGPL